jgi:hypothetical protein
MKRKPQTVAALIQQGRYCEKVQNWYKDGFPTPDKIVFGAKPKLFSFEPGVSITVEQVSARMAESGYEPGTFWDLLKYGAVLGKKDRRKIDQYRGPRPNSYRIVALASRVERGTETEAAPYIAVMSNGRRVALALCNTSDLNPFDMYLGVLKNGSKPAR